MKFSLLNACLTYMKWHQVYITSFKSSTMSRLSRNNVVVFLLLDDLMNQIIAALILIIALLEKSRGVKRKRAVVVERYSMISRMVGQVQRMHRMVYEKDSDCIVNCRMDRNAFARFCFLLREIGGLSDNKYVTVEEQVAMFLAVLGHHKKNKIVKFDFHRSGQSVSYYVHLVLKSVLKIHSLLLVTPKPVTDDYPNQRWKWFKGCLGALDGTYIPLHVPVADRGRYRNRKGTISTNVLAVCDPDLKFVYVLPGWEGSAADARVLRDSVNRPNGLKVPRGNYYLCDNGYANSEGFLVPYRGVRYHLDDWGERASRPQNFHEHFNMRHTRARNVVERAFGIMQMRWGIFRSATYYPIKVQIRLIMACFLIHNFIRNVMPVDPFEVLLDQQPPQPRDDDDDAESYVDGTDSSPEWNAIRDELAQSMYDGWRARR